MLKQANASSGLLVLTDKSVQLKLTTSHPLVVFIGNLTYKSTYANLRKSISSANTRRTYLMLTLFTMLLFIFLQVIMFDAYPDMVIGLQTSKDPPNIWKNF
ncbi:hypothetical protein ES319_A04G054800v1 [Gossypium barbadense]|uniref:Uncharacterized protein n=2 Tax=Gossypium TaxID=3633 RepID=A0A5J5W4M1_GOSBA|nr:hypothetical protein ES319_A04G054800v1 [Gossypium barbadense]TYH21653.1 hypothetical protein ES288_A04G062400v1 [Gossypium darwinii]